MEAAEEVRRSRRQLTAASRHHSDHRLLRAEPAAAALRRFRVRRALNFAIDRRLLVQLYGIEKDPPPDAFVERCVLVETLAEVRAAPPTRKRKALFPGPFLVAGAGFEPATSGL